MVGGQHRFRALAAAAAVVLLAVPLDSTRAAPKPEKEPDLRYTIREARAYAYRATLRREVIEGARQARPCDPNTDPYQCDPAQYEHTPNCPQEIAVGPAGPLPEVRPVPGARPLEGGAGAREGAGAEPPTASPITLNAFLTLSHFGHVGQVVEAGGLASDSYVDLAGRQTPTLQTESDVIPGLPTYEERCRERDPSHRSYRHFLSRTSNTPETFHLAECRRDECPLDRLNFSASDVMARSIIHIREEGGKVIGRIQATFQDAAWSGGAFAVDTVDTVLTFESDGTAEGLRWSVGTTAKGARLGGTPVTLPTGDLVGTPDLQAGVAAPYVDAAEDGTSLRIVAPGMIVASREQTAWFGGAELEANFGAAAEAATAPLDEGEDLDDEGDDASAAGDGDEGAGSATAAGSGTGTGGVIGAGSGAGGPVGGESEQIEGAAPLGGSAETVSSRRFESGLAFILILVGGLLAALWIVSRWMGQFPAGRALSYYPPFSIIERLYRTFAKS